jgi:SAM-dependent methyltransferase
LRAIHCFVKKYLSSLQEGQNLLEVGCGDQRYRSFLPKGVTYDGLDYKQTKIKFYSKTPDPDILGDAQAIPVKSNRFDCILCTEVLEHMGDTARALSEMVRVLKPKGQLIVTVPFLFPEHNSPYDFHRFTVHGIKHECERNGFDVLKTVKLGGTGTMVSGLLVRVLNGLIKSTGFGKVVYCMPGLFFLPFIYLLFNIIGFFLDRLPIGEFYIGTGLACQKRKPM